jgi:hypothetical protein
MVETIVKQLYYVRLEQWGKLVKMEVHQQELLEIASVGAYLVIVETLVSINYLVR